LALVSEVDEILEEVKFEQFKVDWAKKLFYKEGHNEDATKNEGNRDKLGASSEEVRDGHHQQSKRV